MDTQSSLPEVVTNALSTSSAAFPSFQVSKISLLISLLIALYHGLTDQAKEIFDRSNFNHEEMCDVRG